MNQMLYHLMFVRLCSATISSKVQAKLKNLKIFLCFFLSAKTAIRQGTDLIPVVIHSIKKEIQLLP